MARIKMASKKKPGLTSKPITAEIVLQQRQEELELINKKLAQSQADLEAAYRKYADLYDFAPVGYLTMARNGAIHQVNLAGANLLGLSHNEVTGVRLSAFVSGESRSAFKVFFEKLLSGEGKESCELTLGKKGKELPWVRIEATCFEGSDVCRAMLTDITERKRMEQILQESENRFRTLLQDVSTIAVQGYAIDGTTQYWNTASEKLYGYSSQEALGQNLLDLIIPLEMRRDVWHAIQQMGETGQPIPAAELSLMRKDGSRVNVYSSHAIISVPGRMPELFCLDVDLTERKQAEQLLKESEWRNRVVSELTTDYIFVVDVDSNGILRLRWASENLYRITGRTIEEAATSDLWGNIIHPDDKSRFFDFIKQILSTAEAGELECRTFYKSGGERWIWIFARPQLDEENKITTIVGAIQDITERKQAQEALKKSEAHYHDLVETSQDLIWQCDSEGRYTYLNPAWEQVFGYKTREMLGKKFADFQTPQMAARDQKEFSRLMRGNSIKGFETCHIGRLGNEIHLVFNAKSIYDENGKVVGTHGTAYDITERKKAEQALQESESLYRKMNENSPLGMHFYKLNDENQLIFTGANPAADRLLGVDNLQFIGKTIEEAFPPLTRTEVPQRYRDTAAKGVPWSTEQIAYDDKHITGAFDVKAFQTTPRNMVAIFSDITERKQAEVELQHTKEGLEAANRELQTALALQQQLAHTDSLTGIHNRRHLYELAEHEFDIAMRYQQPLSVIMFDIDHFKRVNDTFGHTVGDQILQRVTQVARAELRSADVIGRYGGEEFVVILPMTNAKKAYPLAERIRTGVAAMRVPTEKGDATVTLSIGIVEITHEGQTESIEVMIRNADEAMYAAKQAGRNHTEIGKL